MALSLYSYRRFAVVTMLLLITASLLHPTFSRGCGNSARKRGGLSMEYQKVDQVHNEGITVVHSTSHQTLSKMTHEQIRGETVRQGNGNGNGNGQSESLRVRKMKPTFQCKRQIPGGPDPQHH